jgi:hypothetical protein
MSSTRHTQEAHPGNDRQRSKGNSQRTLRKPVDDFVGYLREYARENPEHMALWCLGIGFVLGWRLKSW